MLFDDDACGLGVEMGTTRKKLRKELVVSRDCARVEKRDGAKRWGMKSTSFSEEREDEEGSGDRWGYIRKAASLSYDATS